MGLDSCLLVFHAILQVQELVIIAQKASGVLILMVFESVSVITPDFPNVFWVYPSPCPCRSNANSLAKNSRRRGKRGLDLDLSWRYRICAKWVIRACVNGGDHHSFDMRIGNTAGRGARNIVIKRFADELDAYGRVSEELEASSRSSNNFASFQEDPFVDKLRTQLGVMHPLPSPPINRIFSVFLHCFSLLVLFLIRFGHSERVVLSQIMEETWR